MSARWSLILTVVHWMVILVARPTTCLDGSFEQDILYLANDLLGLEEFQTFVDQLNYPATALDGGQLVADLALALKTKLENRINAVTALKNATETFYNNYPERTADQQRCCDVTANEVDKRFGTEPVTMEMCTSGIGATTSGINLLPDEVLTAMETNLRVSPSLKWQYFGTEEGKFVKFPASKYCDNTYDPRFRPWYVETATPEPKDVVIVIDRSGSMASIYDGQSLMKIAQDAATTVINTLNPNDRVSVVAFSTIANLPPGSDDTSTCYETQLATATPENQKYLTEFVNGLTASGITMYSLGFQAAFQYFIHGALWDDVSGQRDQVILFLTDGAPSDSSPTIHNMISTQNALMDNSVVIMTYGIGGVLDGSTGLSLLQEIAAQTYYDPSAGPIRAGTFTGVNNLDQLRHTMGSFYNFFKSLQPTPIISVPYIDAFGIGLVTSVCLPVLYMSNLKGVTCVDMAMSDLLADVTYYRKSELSYAFLIDGRGRLMSHPLLPRPMNMEDDPIYLKMTTLETATEAQSVMDNMIAGNVGNILMSSSLTSVKGAVDLEGVTWQNLQSNYYYRPVLGTDFSLCVVIEENDGVMYLVEVDGLPTSFTYHRLDLHRPASACNHFDRLVLPDKSTIKLTGDAFLDPFQYAESQEDFDSVSFIENYIKGSSSNNYAGLKDSIRKTVALTDKFDEILNGKETMQSAVWMYIGTEDGVYRIRPGIQSPQNYDHKLRPWYLRAKSQKNLYTLSMPYVDAFGAGVVITLSHVINEGGASGHPLGVMGIDFPLTYIYSLLMTRYPECKDQNLECFIIDNSGFVVMHRSFVQTFNNEEIQNIHISMKEPGIGDLLQRAGYLKQETCVNYEHTRYQKFTTVTTSLSVDASTYEIHPIANTNIFVVVKKSDVTGQCSSDRFQEPVSLSKCSGNGCERPCYSKLDYNYCKETFIHQTSAPCTPRLPEFNYTQIQVTEKELTKNLAVCIDYKCDEKKTQSECLQVVTCYWCGLPDPDPDSGSYAYCTTRKQCDEDRTGNNLLYIIGIVFGIIALLVIVIMVGVYCTNRGKPKVASAGTTQQQARPRQTDINRNVRPQNPQHRPPQQAQHPPNNMHPQGHPPGHNMPPQGPPPGHNMPPQGPPRAYNMPPQGPPPGHNMHPHLPPLRPNMPPQPLNPMAPPMNAPPQPGSFGMHPQGHLPPLNPNVPPAMPSGMPPPPHPSNIYSAQAGAMDAPPPYDPAWSNNNPNFKPNMA